MKTLTKITAFCLVLLSLTSCVLEGISGNGNVISENRTISEEFDAISASHGLDVYLKIGNNPSVEVEADENLQDIIITEVEDGVLRIYADRNIRTSKSRKIYVTAQNISEIRATSAAEVRSENIIRTEELKINVTSAADIRLDIDVNELSCNATSAAEVRLQGSADNFVAKSTSAAEIRAKNLEVRTCDVEVTSAGNASINVSEELDASATSAGSVRYVGEPKKVRKNSTSGGSIRS